MTRQNKTQSRLRLEPEAPRAAAGDDVVAPTSRALDTADGQASGLEAYQVHLEVFDGPFDLLVQLVARRKLDVSEIDLAEITGEFLAHLHLGDLNAAVDLGTATHFLVVAATLVELKAARLLPGDEEFEELLTEARDLLYARLLEFRAVREAASMLDQLLEGNAGYLPREAPPEPPFERLASAVPCIDPLQLAALAASLLAPRPLARVDLGHIQRAEMSVHEAARRVLARLSEPGEHAMFRSLVTGLSCTERVAHFLALLELYKLGRIDLHQPLASAPLLLERRAGGSGPALPEPNPHPDAGGKYRSTHAALDGAPVT